MSYNEQPFHLLLRLNPTSSVSVADFFTKEKSSIRLDKLFLFANTVVNECLDIAAESTARFN